MRITPSPESVPAVYCAWAAGFFEGEGSVRIGNGRTGHGALVVEVSQIDPEPLKHLQSLWGGSVYLKRPPGPNCRAPSRWMIYGRVALRFIIDISPYVIRREVRDKIYVAVEFQQQKTRGRRNSTPAYRRTQHAFKASMTKLNQRGVH